MAEGDPGAGAGAGAGAGVITAEGLGKVEGDAFRSLLPADIQAKPYAKDINNFGDFVKRYDGAQALLGQRNVPAATDPDEKWAEFHGKMRPEKPEGYVIPEVQGVPPEIVKQWAEGPLLKSLLHKANASPYQAKILSTEIMSLLYKAQMHEEQESVKATQAKDASFAKLAGDLFGDNKDNVIANGKKFLAANLPENVRPLLEGMSEKELTVVLAATDGMARKFTGEDPFRGGGGNGGGGGETKDQLVAQMQAIMKEPAYGDPLKDRVKNADLNARMEVIRGKLKKLQGGQ